jgi:hypothetical protein
MNNHNIDSNNVNLQISNTNNPVSRNATAHESFKPIRKKARQKTEFFGSFKDYQQLQSYTNQSMKSEDSGVSPARP